jgi:branched-chain amino acid transport system ATP-binding protein
VAWREERVNNDVILSLAQVTKTFGGLKAVNGVSFEVSKGEIVSLVGPNGSGKTTLFNCISGIYTVNNGKILFLGENISHFSPPRICKMGIGRTFQVVRPFLRLTCLENILVGLYFGQEGQKKESRREGLRMLEFVGLGEKASKPAMELRLAERKRLEIARALATRPKLLLLDEVAAGLNEAEIQEMIRLLRQIHTQGITLLVVEHVMSLVMDLSYRVVVLNEGKKIADGLPEIVANDQQVINVYLGQSHDPP